MSCSFNTQKVLLSFGHLFYATLRLMRDETLLPMDTITP
jgi:hypothetical protein